MAEVEATAMTSPHDEPARTYRVRRLYFNIGIATTIGFTLASIATVVAVQVAPNDEFPNPVRFTAMAVTFFGALSLLGVYVAAAYIKYRLHLSDSQIRQSGVFRSQAISIPTIQQVHWRSQPSGGSVVIEAPDHRIKIELGSFASEDRDAIVVHLRHELRESLQVGWESFNEDVFDPSAQVLEERQRERSSLYRRMSLSFFASAAVFVTLAFVGLGHHQLLFAAMNLGAAVLAIRNSRG